ncbi:glucosaminidase domain-containing protein [Actinospongicola halichondriae]|uniref:glucosaminidase domain-containing protein n=1 Tax=Actinospongicola halichondriae TaxID=3236844 RepID=UPI003D4B69AF
MGSDRHPAQRARRTLAGALAVVLGVSLLASGTAAGQESPAPTTTAAPGPTTTTAPPVTVVLDEGDIGVVPPGSDGDVDAPPPDDGEPAPPADGELEVPDELPVVILPDPTPGLNAALAAIDVRRATDALAEGRTVRQMIDAELDRAYTARAEAVTARRRAGVELLAAKSVIDQLVVQVVVHGDTDSLQPLFGQASLEDLRDLELHGVAADKVHADFELARAAYRSSIEAENAATAALDDTAVRARFVHAIEVGLRNALDEAIRKAEEARQQVGPTILGPAVLDQADLVAWYRTYYRADPPVGPIDAIIESYLRVGEEEGVAGDIAFAQAILETGGFRSGHAGKWNFAGIGAYDSCSPTCSFSFPSLDEGVRAHIHLLRAYADPGLTTAQLAATPNRQVAPERVGVRGCCQRWTQLTGVWATDPNYDRKVLGIYRLMVETARALDARTQ